MRRLGGISGLVLGLGLCATCGCDAQADPDYRGEALATLRGAVEATVVIQAAEVGVLWFTSSPGDECSGPTLVCSQGTGYASLDATTSQCIEGCGDAPDCMDTAAIGGWEGCMAACGVDAEVPMETEFQLCASSAVGQSVPVTGEFPAQYTLDLMVEPPPEALLPDDQGSRVALAYIVVLASGTTDMTISSGAEQSPDWLLGGSETHVLVYAEDAVVEGSGWASLLGGPLEPGYHLIEWTRSNACVSPTTCLGCTEPQIVDQDDNSVTDFADTQDFCGNGVCERGETCANCSDCSCAEPGASATSTGILFGADGYSCVDTDAAAREAPEGFDAEVALIVGPLDEMSWPTL